MEKLQEVRTKDDDAGLVSLEKTSAFNFSGHVLHSLLWENLAPDGGGRPEEDLAAAIVQDFGSFGAFQAQLGQGAVPVQGSGWGALAFEPIAGKPLIQQIYDHHAKVAQGSVPLLVFDVWEHAYYLQYRNVRADFAEVPWNVVNWPTVAERSSRARQSMSG